MKQILITETNRLPVDLRMSYLNGLSESQEFMLESLVQSGRYFLFGPKTAPFGYAATKGKTIVEFFVRDFMLGETSSLMKELLSISGTNQVLCKSFDSVMVGAAAFQPCEVKTAGLLFRKRLYVQQAWDPHIRLQLGTEGDIPSILQMHDHFFSGPEEILSYLKEDGLFLYKNETEELVGIGIMKRIITWKNDFDIGMVVSPRYRRRGLGSAIVAHLREHCISKGYHPVCGCSADNEASKRSLEKAGFVCDYRLLEFSYV